MSVIYWAKQENEFSTKRFNKMIDQFLRQAPGQFVPWNQTLQELKQICESSSGRLAS